MRIERRFTEAGKSPYDGIEFRTTTSEIKNPDGSIVFQARNIEVPAEWSQVACDVLAQKYFRKAGVPVRLKSVREADLPDWLCRHVPDEDALGKLDKDQRTSGETKATQVFDRMAGTWTYWGWRGGYFDAETDARALLRRDVLHAGAADGGAELAAMVQHRPALGLWHRRAVPGSLLRRLPHGQAGRLGLGL